MEGHEPNSLSKGIIERNHVGLSCVGKAEQMILFCVNVSYHSSKYIWRGIWDLTVIGKEESSIVHSILRRKRVMIRRTVINNIVISCWSYLILGKVKILTKITRVHNNYIDVLIILCTVIVNLVRQLDNQSVIKNNKLSSLAFSDFIIVICKVQTWHLSCFYNILTNSVIFVRMICKFCVEWVKP